MTKPELTIRPATIEDCTQILRFVTELAIYEKAEHEVVATEEHFKQTLFCDNPKAFCLIAETNEGAVGFAIYFYSFSTWLGKLGIYLEDLYVTPEQRGIGAGKALLKRLATIALENDCGRVEWSVLDWNEPSIKFYEAMGAKIKDGWLVYRLAGEALTNFAD